MSNPSQPNRPPFEDALRAWQSFLHQRNLPSELTWIFDENLCFEKDPASPEGYRLFYQTAFTPPPAEAARLAYEYYREFDAPLVFYRIGTSRNKSVCVFLCDDWFAAKGEKDGFVAQSPWRILFRPGGQQEIEETVSEDRWKSRIIRNRPLHDLDFCMELRAIHEMLAHGRVLTTYEHYALKLLGVWRKVFTERHS